jgi:CRP-like cAMP-binding protein
MMNSRLARELRRHVFLPGDSVMKQGDVGDHLFFLVEGQMRVFLRRSGTDVVDREVK